VGTKNPKPAADGTGRTARKPMNLKKLAEHLGLSQATVSLVINRSSVADSIPQETKDRIFAAARKFEYRPSFFSRSLRTQHSFTIGVIVPKVSEEYSATVVSGVEDYLLSRTASSG
jgi:LacI family transcriptional regulator